MDGRWKGSPLRRKNEIAMSAQWRRDTYILVRPLDVHRIRECKQVTYLNERLVGSAIFHSIDLKRS